MTNASIMFTAFVVSVICSIIVFVSGMFSGVVRLGTSLTRTFFTFLMAGAASYFILMLFDWYYEKKQKKFSELQANAESAQVEGSADNTDKNTSAKAANQTPQTGFKPLNPNDLPNA